MDENKVLDESKPVTKNQPFENPQPTPTPDNRAFEGTSSSVPPTPTPTPTPAQSNVYRPMTENNIPSEYTPITMWGYFGYSFLFSIPLIGFIITCVFAFGGTSNVNLKNYARSMFCWLIIFLVVFVICGIFGLAGAAFSAFR